MSTLEKLKKNSRIKESDVMSDSQFFGEVELTSTAVPMINVALSGSLDGGLNGGITTICGNSRHFKTSYALLMASSYLNKHKDAALLFYDSEFGSPQSYFESFGIDTSRVLHTPIKDVEELKFDIIHQLDQLDKKDKVIVVIDSIGNLASKKELEDAQNEKSVTDMTRAKSFKGLFRMITPYIKMKNIPCLIVNHIYMTQEMFSKPVVSGGTGVMLSSDNVWIIGRQQDKVGTEIQGYHFIINIEKSRFVKEKSKIPISVSWEGGIDRYSGLLDLALEYGTIVKDGHFVRLTDLETGNVQENKIRPKNITNEYWDALIKYQPFYDFIKNKYTLSMSPMINNNQTEDTDD